MWFHTGVILILRGDSSGVLELYCFDLTPACILRGNKLLLAWRTAFSGENRGVDGKSGPGSRHYLPDCNVAWSIPPVMAARFPLHRSRISRAISIRCVDR